MAKKIATTLGPELLREIRAVIAAEKRRVAGDLRDDRGPPEKSPDCLVVLTPEGGIPGRDGLDISSAACHVHRVVEYYPGTAGGLCQYQPIQDGSGNPHTLYVYNVYCEDVPGGIYVPTALLKSGHRFVIDWRICESSSESDSEPPSDSSSEPPSESDSSESSEPPSESDSSESSEPPSESESSLPPSESESSLPPSESESGSLPSEESDKSTAIVPASWTPGGYTALFTLEAPEVRFDDVLTAVVNERETYVPIDVRYIEVCEPGTIEVCGCVPADPVAVGASVEGAGVVVRLARARKRSVTVTIRLTAIRKGFAGHRFPDRTREQFLANERFIRSAYPGAGQ